MLETLQLVEIEFNRADEARFGAVLQDVADQVTSLVYPGFVTAVGSRRLPDIRRYLEAAGRRLQRLAENPARDAELMAVIHELEAELDRLRDALPDEPRLLDIAWMIQELRVSFFAQALGTRGKVSEQRIRRALNEIEMGD